MGIDLLKTKILFILALQSDCINNYDGFQVDSDGGLSHQFQTQYLDFKDAENNCQNLGGSLAMGRDLVEFNTMIRYNYLYPRGKQI